MNCCSTWPLLSKCCSLFVAINCMVSVTLSQATDACNAEAEGHGRLHALLQVNKAIVQPANGTASSLAEALKKETPLDGLVNDSSDENNESSHVVVAFSAVPGLKRQGSLSNKLDKHNSSSQAMVQPPHDTRSSLAEALKNEHPVDDSSGKNDDSSLDAAASSATPALKGQRSLSHKLDKHDSSSTMHHQSNRSDAREVVHKQIVHHERASSDASKTERSKLLHKLHELKRELKLENAQKVDDSSNAHNQKKSRTSTERASKDSEHQDRKGERDDRSVDSGKASNHESVQDTNQKKRLRSKSDASDEGDIHTKSGPISNANKSPEIGKAEEASPVEATEPEPNFRLQAFDADDDAPIEIHKEKKGKENQAQTKEKAEKASDFNSVEIKKDKEGKAFEQVEAGIGDTATVNELEAKAQKAFESVGEEASLGEAEQEASDMGAVASGELATLNEAGYRSVVSLCCSEQMKLFLKRAIESEGLAICDEGGVSGTVIWFDCADDGQTYDVLLQKLHEGTEGPCPFLRSGPECPARQDDCPTFPDATMPECGGGQKFFGREFT